MSVSTVYQDLSESLESTQNRPDYSSNYRRTIRLNRPSFAQSFKRCDFISQKTNDSSLSGTANLSNDACSMDQILTTTSAPLSDEFSDNLALKKFHD